ncbi:SNF2-related protein [Penicillium cataractarum]|uniref:SNF2-related protein n=1 Tax=Penicillium cataractarum TaxID=2100454 RepID=A0A9W9V178_9EURO|nr:SNF2-related protein [Penicillium cataractarum]KAJ5363984.1 SNF2-related protein [Penicillium cataractarum]
MSPTLPPQPAQATPLPGMLGPSNEEVFQAQIQEALAPVLSELSAPLPTDLKIHANERVIKDLTKNPTIKDMQVGARVPVAKPMEPEDRKALANMLTRELDNFLECQALYEPEDITSVPLNKDIKSQVQASGDVGGQGEVAVEKRSTTDQTLTVGEACRRLGLRKDPVTHLPLVEPGDSSGRPPFSLRPWQAPGIEWMMAQESEPIRGGIVADGYGLGKTLMALTLIFLDAKRRALDPNAVFRPTLIVVPSWIFHIWFDEITVRFGNAIKLHLFYGWQEILPDPVSTPNFLLGAEADKLDKLAKAIAALDSRSSHTAFTVFLTTYNTWRRSQGEIEDALLRRSNKRREVRWIGHRSFYQGSDEPQTRYDRFYKTGDESDDEDEESTTHIPMLTGHTVKEDAVSTEASSPPPAKTKAEKTKAEREKEKKARAKQRWMEIYKLVSSIHWGRIICDTGSYLKSTFTQRHHAIAKLTRESTWLLDAAPIRNNLLDTLGYVSILSKSIPECKKFGNGRFILPLPPGLEEGERLENTIDYYRKWSEIDQIPPEARP